jgi:16S rRNA (uracil1498-N3)-methyltransferase
MLQQNKIHRIFLKNIIEINNAIKLDKDTSNHIKNVLRIRNNEEIKIFNGDGKEYNAKVEYQGKIYYNNSLQTI